MYSPKNFRIVALNDDEEMIYSSKVREIDLTHNGEVMAISDPMNPKDMVESGAKENDAYSTARDMHDKYICLSYDDAQNIADMLNEAIEKLGPKDESFGDDIAVFGEKAISYERLVDRLNGLCYPVWKYNKEKKEEKEDA